MINQGEHSNTNLEEKNPSSLYGKDHRYSWWHLLSATSPQVIQHISRLVDWSQSFVLANRRHNFWLLCSKMFDFLSDFHILLQFLRYSEKPTGRLSKFIIITLNINMSDVCYYDTYFNKLAESSIIKHDVWYCYCIFFSLLTFV